MRRLLPASILLLVTVALPAAAQDLLPPSFSGWTSPAPSLKITSAATEEFAGGDAAILREYGILGAERRGYARGDESLTITLFRMRDSSAAFGAYTYHQTSEMSPTNLTQYSSVSPRRALVVAGNLLLEVSGSGVPRLTPDLKALVAQLAPHADKAPFPTLVQYLPTLGRISQSERYVLGPLALNRLLPLGNGDWLGFADGAEAVLARYRVKGQEATLLLVSYPTPQAAARKLEELGHWLPLNVERQADGRPPLFARRSSTLVAIVSQLNSRATADSLLERVHYESRITWNEPDHRLTDPNIGTIVVGAILGTGFILLFALVAGIGFGGVRIVVKHFFPGKVFDRAAHVEILQLGLTSKPIKAKDFY